MSKFATKEDAGKSSGEENRGVAGESKPRILRKPTEERFATWTENLGFESFSESSLSSDTREEEEEEGRDQSPEMGSGSKRRMMRRKSTWLDMSNFPPLLSTLNKNGRPGFDFIKMRDNGRLQMTMVPSERPEVVTLQTPPMRMDKRLKMLLIKTDDDQDREDQQHHDHHQKEEERLQSSAAMVLASDDQKRPDVAVYLLTTNSCPLEKF